MEEKTESSKMAVVKQLKVQIQLLATEHGANTPHEKVRVATKQGCRLGQAWRAVGSRYTTRWLERMDGDMV